MLENYAYQTVVIGSHIQNWHPSHHNYGPTSNFNDCSSQ